MIETRGADSSFAGSHSLPLARLPHRGTERLRTMESKEGDGARQRLQAAEVERDRLGEQLDAAVGTSSELEANVRLRAAGKQVAAREAWVHWVDDDSYPGGQRSGADGPELMSSEEQGKTVGRWDGLHRAQGNRRVDVIKARVDLPTRRGGRVWLNGRESGGREPRFVHLSEQHD